MSALFLLHAAQGTADPTVSCNQPQHTQHKTQHLPHYTQYITPSTHPLSTLYLCCTHLNTGTGTADFPYFAATLKDVSRWATRDNCSATVQQTYNDGTFSNIVWPACRDGREVELMSVRNGVHSWWTRNYGGFETAEYAMRWFDRTHGKQLAADEEREKQQQKKQTRHMTDA